MITRAYVPHDGAHPDRLPCCVEVRPGETAEEAEARRRALAESHESVLAALARILLGREQAQREEPWSLPSIGYHDDDRGLER